MRRLWSNARCFFGWHYWPSRPTSRTWTQDVFVCTNTSCLYVKATER